MKARQKLLPWRLATDLSSFGLQVRDLVLYTNGHCNLRCAHCYVGNELLAEGPEFEALSIGASIAKFGSLARLTLLGGEILRHSQADEIFDLVDTTNIREARLTTNLTVWHEAAISAAIQRGFRFCVSLDGASPATHDRMRGAGTFIRTVHHLERLLTKTTNVEITHTVCRWNVSDLGQLIELCRGIGVRFLNLHLVTAQGNALEHRDMSLTPSEWRALISRELTPASWVEPAVVIRYPLRFATRAEYDDLVRHGYHHHAAGSYYTTEGHRVVVYATGDVFVSSEAFGTEAMIGSLSDSGFVPNRAARNELTVANVGSDFDVSDINPNVSGDAAYPVALSVSFKLTTMR